MPGLGLAQGVRDCPNMVSDVTLYRLAATAVEAFGASTRFKYPQIQSANAAVGFALFCAGRSLDQPDIILTIRPMSPEERLRCVGNGIQGTVDIELGSMAAALVEAAAEPAMAPTFQDLFRALAEKLPEVRPTGTGKPAGNPLTAAIVPNTATDWRQVDPSLPERRIRLLAGPAESAARALFTDLIMLPGCRELPVIAALEAADAGQFRRTCSTLRHDGTIDEALHGEAELLNALTSDPNAMVLTNFDFAERNAAKVRAVPLNGVAPSAETINNGTYPAARPVQLYVKRDNLGIVPGLREFMALIAGVKAIGPDGFLIKAGLVPLADEAKAQTQNILRNVVKAPPRGPPPGDSALEEARKAEEARAKEAARAASAEQKLTEEQAHSKQLDAAAKEAAAQASQMKLALIETSQALDAARAAARAGHETLERELWDFALAEHGSSIARRYLELYPEGMFVQQAHTKIAEAPLEPAPPPPAPVERDVVLPFEPGQVKLTPAQEGTLDELATLLKSNPALRLAAEGHTDNVGSPERNRSIATERVRQVEARLVADGIEIARIAVTAIGAVHPAAPNDTAHGRARNRRVELHVGLAR